MRDDFQTSTDGAPVSESSATHPIVTITEVSLALLIVSAFLLTCVLG